ncbi:MAG: hypothetical protein H8Z69_03570 [Nanohaloarchaea archaeon]|nr:hypothetical protein [Candidatus Nanohaloarchaea archaeon]
MRKTALIVGLIFMTAAASATIVESEEVNVDLASGDVEVDLYIQELTSSSISYTTSYNIEDVEASINGQELDCSTESLQFGSEISCDTEMRDNFSVKLNFSSDNLVSTRQNANILRYSHSVYRPTQEYRMRVLLPQGTGLLDEDEVSIPVVSPEDYRTGSNGRRIFVEWDQNPQLGDTLNFQIVYDKYENSNGFPVAMALSILTTLIVAGLGYFGYKRLNRESVESVYDQLSSDEIDVIELLRENEGEMLQKDVVDRSDYSKAKISGVVSELVDKEIVTKEKEGRSNKLRIVSKYSH